MSTAAADPSGPTSPAHDSAFLQAARGQDVPHTPVWFMRQAGRSLPEYLRVREGVAMLDACMDPELVVEITMQPVRRYGVDPEQALRASNAKFERRFKVMEQLSENEGEDFAALDLERQEEYWQRAKRETG